MYIEFCTHFILLFMEISKLPSIFSFNISFYSLQIEVFNILFIREQEKRHVVHCMDCARKQSPSLEGFVCLEEYRMRDLMDVYDGFTLHMPQVTATTSATTSSSSSSSSSSATAVAAAAMSTMSTMSQAQIGQSS